MPVEITINEGVVWAIIATATFASLSTLFWLFQKHIAGRPLMAFAPRRPVPWNFLAPAFVLTPAIVTLWVSVSPRPVEPTVPAEQRAPADDHAAVELSPAEVWAQTAFFISLTAGCYALLAAVFGADARDLGLPRTVREFSRDVAAGTVAFLAVLLPVYSIQMLLTLMLEPEDIHPLIEELQANPSPQLIAAAAAAAVVGAPLFEETAFRLVFQGWLERRRDVRRQRQASQFAGLPADDGGASPESTGAGDSYETPSSLAPVSVQRAQPPSLDWTAILISAAAFSLAHLGHGVAPISLLPLGATLGYLYQRTHRVAAPMVCHAMFNSFSLSLMWLDHLGNSA
jgi:membrane protease YdiL (CAAX protease family)